LTVDGINVEATIKKLRNLLAKEQNISPALSTTLETLLIVVQLLADRLGLNSRNSSKPPSTDKNRPREKHSGENKRKAGGQPGRVGTTLRQVDDPDEIEMLTVDRSTLPPGVYREAGFDRRQARAKDGADIFCRVRSFLSTCRKNSLSASEALTLLFGGKLPEFL